jgi:hypothetical protein
MEYFVCLSYRINPKLLQKKVVTVAKLLVKTTIPSPLIFFLQITAKGNVGERCFELLQKISPR